MTILARSQRVMLWTALGMAIVFGLSFTFLMRMVPLLPATWTASEVAAHYARYGLSIRLGAVICSFTGGFMVPLSVVIAAQIARLERGMPIWAILAVAGGTMMSLFLVLPSFLWGVAAFAPDRPAEITAQVNELANLMMVTTNQYWVFLFIAVTYISLTQRIDARSPFPRWLGYLTIWVGLVFEAGSVAFLTRTGPFAWNGLFPFWLPFGTFGIWLTMLSIQLFGAIRLQAAVDG